MTQTEALAAALEKILNRYEELVCEHYDEHENLVDIYEECEAARELLLSVREKPAFVRTHEEIESSAEDLALALNAENCRLHNEIASFRSNRDAAIKALEKTIGLYEAFLLVSMLEHQTLKAREKMAKTSPLFSTGIEKNS